MQTPIEKLTMLVAQSCNMRCRYCCAGDGSYGSNTGLMSIDTARKSIDFLVANSAKNSKLDVTFYGGEPLLNWKAIRDTILYAKQKKSKRKFGFTILTNGTLLNREIINFCKRNRIHIQISIDGSQRDHDKNRVFADGSGSYDRIIRNLKAVKDKRNISVMITITHKNPRILGTIMNLLKTGITKFRVELVSSAARGMRITRKDLAVLKKDLVKISKYIVKEVKKGRTPFYFFNTESLLDFISYGWTRRFYCTQGDTEFTVSTKGDIFSCMFRVEDKNFYMGTVEKGIPDSKRNSLLRELDVDCNKYCSKCRVRHLCGGGCRYERYIRRREKPDPVKCGYMRFLSGLSKKMYCDLKTIHGIQ